MLFGISRTLAVLLPLFLAQYLLAIVALTRLAVCRLPVKKYLVWNLVILFVFFVGSLAFFGYYFGKRRAEVRRLESDEAASAGAGAAPAESAAESIRAEEGESAPGGTIPPKEE